MTGLIRNCVAALAVAAVLTFAAGAPAQETDGGSLLYSGLVELGLGYTWASCDHDDGSACGSGDDLDDETYAYLEGSGRANIPLSDAFSLQADVDGWNTFTGRDDGDGGEENLQTFFAGALHATWRAPETGAAGGFVQLGSSNSGNDENATFWLLGAEGQFYLGDFTLYGQAGYFDADDEDEDDVMTDAFFVRGVARWFLNDNFRLQGEFSWAAGEEADSSPADNFTFYSWGLRADRVMGSNPIALFAAYEGLWGEEEEVGCSPCNETYTEHRLIVGVAFHFGVSDLKAQDRRGATLDTPDVGRWTAASNNPLD